MDIYSDEGITGTSIKNRDGFNRMIDDALAGKIDLTNKAAVIAACKAAKKRFTDCPELQAERDKLAGEMNEVTVLTQQCISEKQSGQGSDFAARYNGYVERYEKAKARYDEITEILDARAAKGRAIERFLRDISGRDKLLAEFDAVLWLTVIDTVTVRRDGVLVFRFQNGREIEG